VNASLEQLFILIFAAGLASFAGFIMLNFSWHDHKHVARERCDLLDFSVNLIHAATAQAIHCLEEFPDKTPDELALLTQDIEKLEQLAARLTLVSERESVAAVSKIALALKRTVAHCKQGNKQRPTLNQKFIEYLQQRKMHSLHELSKQYQTALSKL